MTKGREWTSRNIPKPPEDPILVEGRLEDTRSAMAAWHSYYTTQQALRDAESAEARAHAARQAASSQVKHYEDLLEELGGQATIPMPGERDDA